MLHEKQNVDYCHAKGLGLLDFKPIKNFPLYNLIESVVWGAKL